MKLLRHNYYLLRMPLAYSQLADAKYSNQSEKKITRGFTLKIKTHLSLFLILFTHAFVFSQDPVKLNQLRHELSVQINDTTRINTLRQIGKLYAGIIEDSALYFTKKALILAEKINWTKGIAQNSLNIGVSLANTSKYDSALYYDNKALEAAKIVGDKNRIALIYNNRSNVYTETQQYEKAMADIRQTLRLSDETGNKDRQARAYQAMCEMYMYQENYEAAMPWALKALELDKEIGNEELGSIAEMSLGGLYSLKNDFQKAEVYLLDAIPKASKSNRPDMIVECYLSLSDDYIHTHRYEKAIEILQKGTALARQLELIDRMSALYQNLGSAFYDSKKYNEALAAHQKGYEAIKGKKEFQKNQYGNLEGMAQSYAALGNYKNAYESANLASSIKDSALKNQRDEKLLKLQTQFETERKEKQIELLKKDQQLNQASLQKHKTFQYAAYIIVGLLVLIGFLVINRYRSVQRAKRLTEIDQMRNNIARDLHDDIGSTLTSINILSKVALQQAAETNGSTRNIQKIKERSADIMDRMNDIVWAINPANDALDKIILRMKEFGAEILEQAGMQFSFKEEGELNDVKLSLVQRSSLYLIFKEAVNNAVKYSGANEVCILLQKDPANLILKISDDGKGFDNLGRYSGNGLKNMLSRSTDIKALFQLQSMPGNGTTIYLTVPIV